MIFCDVKPHNAGGPAAWSGRAGKTVRGRRSPAAVAAAIVALAMLAAGCGSAGSPGGQSPPSESAATGSNPTVPRLLAAVQPATAAAGSTSTDSPAATAALPAATAAEAPTAAATAALPTTSTTVPPVAESSGPEPEGGHPPHPEVGMIPRDLPYWEYPNCAPGPPWPSDCYPPSEWEIPQDLSDCKHSAYPDEGAGGICAGRRAGETPRWTRDVARWTSWCFDQPRGNCTWLLHEMKWALDFLGAHPWCVLNEYQDRADAYGAGGRGTGVKNSHGWHNCATVIDPLADGTRPGRSNDAGLLLSDQTTLAEQCSIVLPAGVQLEARVRRRSEQPERFGSDCDAWAEWVQTRPSAEDWRDCDRSARLAEEWMEHHYATPERYFPATC